MTTTNNNKYLVLLSDGCRQAGLDHMLAVLKGAIKEAVHLNRILVINKFSINPTHNLGHKLENIEFKQYINLDKTHIYKTCKNGSIQQIDDSFQYIDTENFSLDEYSEAQVLLIDKDIKPVSEEQNNQYKVIARKTTDYNYTQYHLDITVDFYPADKINHLADTVLKAMGTSLADAKMRSTIYRNSSFSTNNDTFKQNVPIHPLYYACLHVRSGMKDRLYFPSLRYAATPSHLRKTIECAIPVKSTIYIMSDINNPRYFDFLKKDYTLYFYSDFPELKALISKNNEQIVDNMMLYSVEKNIMQYAYIKVLPVRKRPKIIYNNYSNKVPLRYKIIATLHYLFIRHYNLIRPHKWPRMYRDIKNLISMIYLC